MNKAILELFPDGVAGAELCDFSAASPLWHEERDAVAGALESRVREFQAGRHCARVALLQLGHPVVAIPRRSDRAPAWPRSVVGSISHCPGYCGAAVAWADEFAGLGFDAEQRGRLSDELLALIATDSELRRLEGIRPAERAQAADVLFSSKESFFKAQFPITQIFLDFQDVAIDLLDDGRLVAELQSHVPALDRAGKRFPGRWRVTSRHVFTAIALPQRARNARQHGPDAG